MKLALQAQDPLEWMFLQVALKANLIPMPQLHGLCGGIFSKVTLAASRLGLFEAAKDSPQTLEEIARKTGLNPKALTAIMPILMQLEYFKYKNGKFALTRIARKYLLKESPDSTYNFNRYSEIMVHYMDFLDQYLKEGEGISMHDNMTEDEWHWYQLGMEFLASKTSKAASKMTPMPSNPTEMLDIGGSHGLYCVELCREYPAMKATILDLPEAVKKARPILAKYNMGDRINYWVGNALTDDLGENRYDLVLMSALMHHFNAEQNMEVSRKVAKALRPGGHFVVQEFLRTEISEKKNSMSDVVGMITNLIFNVSSFSNTWSLEELKRFQEGAGLTPFRVNKFGLIMPSFVQVCASKA